MSAMNSVSEVPTTSNHGAPTDSTTGAAATTATDSDVAGAYCPMAHHQSTKSWGVLGWLRETLRERDSGRADLSLGEREREAERERERERESMCV